MDFETKIKEEFQKHGVSVLDEDPAAILAKAVTEEAVAAVKKISDQSSKSATWELEKAFKNVSAQLLEELTRETKNIVTEIHEEKKQAMHTINQHITDSLEKYKRTANAYWAMSMALIVLTILLTFWMPKAAAADLGLKTMNVENTQLIGGTGSVSLGSLLSIKGNLNKSVSAENMTSINMKLKLFPAAIFQFGTTYSAAESDTAEAKALEVDAGFKAANLYTLVGYKRLALSSGFDERLTGISTLGVKTMLKPKLSTEAVIDYAKSIQDSSDTFRATLGTRFHWTKNVQTIHAVDYTCDQQCDSPIGGTLGIRLKPSKKYGLTLSLKTYPTTALSPLETQVSDFEGKRMTTVTAKVNVKI